jgi:mRNA interferase RelE/StbE
MYKLILSYKAEKQLKKFDSITQRRIISALERIKVRPWSYVSKLVGDPGYKFRVGNYKIIMDIDKGNLIILVIKMAHRKKVYK